MRGAVGLLFGLGLTLLAGQALAGEVLTAASGTVAAGARFLADGVSHTATGAYDDHASYAKFGSQSDANLSTITPYLSAYGTGAACFCGAATGGGEGRAYLSYSFEFLGGPADLMIPVTITYNMVLSVLADGYAEGQFIVFNHAYNGAFDPIYNDSSTIGGTTNVFGLNVTRSFSFNAAYNTENSIFMGVLANSSNSFTHGAASAYLDPIISIDPAFAALHPGTSLVLSDGVLNAEPGGAGGGVPEPASWALMIAGFGLAGAALRRRRGVVEA